MEIVSVCLSENRFRFNDGLDYPYISLLHKLLQHVDGP